MSIETETIREGPASSRKVAIGAMASGAVSIAKIAIQLLLLPVMGRLLGPDEFGLFALALPVITFVILLADGGLGASLAREEESSGIVWSSAFWALLFMGVALALSTTVLGVLLGYLAQEPRLPGIIAFLSLSLICLTVSVVPSARLMRRKNLGIGAGADLVATATAAAVAILLAARGAGAWSLAIQYVILNALRSIILNFAAFHLPRFTFSFQAIRPHLITGGLLVGSRMGEFAGRIAENLFVNRIFGTAILGNYTFANQISRFSTDAAGNTVWAGLYVQALTGDKDKIVVLHRQLCRLLGILLLPTTFLAAAAAPELISLMLGPKWADLPFFLRIYLPLYSLSAICSQTGPILLARNRFEIQFWCMLGYSLGRILAVVLGFWVGLEGTMCSMIVVTLLFCIAMLVFPAETTGCHPLPMLRGLVRPAISSVVATGAFFLINGLIPTGATWILANLTVGFIVFAVCMILIDAEHLKEDWNSVRRILLSRDSKQ